MWALKMVNLYFFELLHIKENFIFPQKEFQVGVRHLFNWYIVIIKRKAFPYPLWGQQPFETSTLNERRVTGAQLEAHRNLTHKKNLF